MLWKKAIQLARKAESFALSSLLKAEFEKMLLISGSHTSYGELLKLFSENAITYEDYAALITLRDIYAEIILIKRNAHFEISESDSSRKSLPCLRKLIVTQMLTSHLHSGIDIIFLCAEFLCFIF